MRLILGLMLVLWQGCVLGRKTVKTVRRDHADGDDAMAERGLGCHSTTLSNYLAFRPHVRVLVKGMPQGIVRVVLKSNAARRGPFCMFLFSSRA